MSSKTIRRISLVLIFFLALGVRFFLLSKLHHTYFMAGITVADGELAWHLSRGEGFVVNEAFMADISAAQNASHTLIDIGDVPRPAGEFLVPYRHALPGYALLLASFYRLTGRARYIDLQVFQAILDSCGIFLIYVLGGRAFSKTIGLISAFLYAIWVPEARLAIAPLHDAPMAFLLLLSTYVFSGAERKDSKPLMALSAFILGLTAYIRSDYIFFPGFLALAAYLKRKSKSSGVHDPKPMLLHGIWMTGIVFLVLIPWGVRNYLTFHRFTILRPVLWQSVWEGLGEFPNSFGAVLDDSATFHMVEADHPGISYFDPEYQAILKGKTLRAFKDQPGWFLAMLLRRFPRMLFSRNDWGLPLDPGSNWQTFKAGGGHLVGYIKDTPWIQMMYRILMRVGENGLVILALVGIFLARNSWRNFIILLAAPACGFLMHLPIYWEPRYLLPGNFPFLIFSGVALEAVRRRIRP